MRRALFSSRSSLGAAALLAFLALPAGAARAAVPIGYIDGAGCDAIAGWSQDPDEPAKGIAVHVYFGGPAGTPGAPGVATTANVHREDLCAAIGSCEHGFVVLSPLSLHDGQPRDVFAYGIDTGGEGNPALVGSPKSLACAPSAQSGVRRRVDGVPVYDAWRFSSFWDLLPLGAAEADALPDGPDVPAMPELVRADDGTPDVWLVDRGVRRAVTGAAAASWRFDLSTVVDRPAAEVQALVEGTPLRARPVLFVRGALYLVDDPQPEAPGASSSSSAASGGSGGAGGADATAAGSGGNAAGAGDAAEGSCALAMGASRGGSAAGRMGLVAIGAALLAARRRRNDRRRPSGGL